MNPLTSPGLWLMPTRGRALSNLPRFFAAAAKTGMSTPGVLLIDEDDYAQNQEVYDALELPPSWVIHTVKGGGCALATEEALADLLGDAPEMRWIGWLGDDLVPETPGWDVKVVEALNGWNMVSTNDGAHAPKKFNGATAWSADLVRAIGFLFPPGLQHFYLDDAAEAIGRRTGCWSVLMDVMVRHAHASFTGSADQTLARIKQFWENDDKAWAAWKETGLAPACERVINLMLGYGVSMTIPDLTGVKVMIATPCGSGRYEALFVDSLMETQAMIRQYGGESHWAQMKYSSDVVSARNLLFAAFLGTEDTHILWIDDDMGWNPMDAVRLLMSGKDFAAVAGPRKVFPPSFAVNVADARGQSVPVQMDTVTGMLQASGVGMAFTCLTRHCADRMAESFPELEYETQDGRSCVAVFNPLVVNRRYLSEDYAFCYRWREIGGYVWVDSSIPLKHVGAHVWEGAWLTQLAEKSAQERAA